MDWPYWLSFFSLQPSLVAGILPHLRDQAMEAVFLTAPWKVSWVPPPLPHYSLINMALTPFLWLSHVYQFGDFSFLEGEVKILNSGVQTGSNPCSVLGVLLSASYIGSLGQFPYL